MDKNKNCREYLKNLRKILHPKPEERIDKRYKPYLAPNGKYYDAHCGYCAEVKYLLDIYKDKNINGGIK